MSYMLFSLIRVYVGYLVVVVEHFDPDARIGAAISCGRPALAATAVRRRVSDPESGLILCRD